MTDKSRLSGMRRCGTIDLLVVWSAPKSVAGKGHYTVYSAGLPTVTDVQLQVRWPGQAQNLTRAAAFALAFLARAGHALHGAAKRADGGFDVRCD